MTIPDSETPPMSPALMAASREIVVNRFRVEYHDKHTGYYDACSVCEKRWESHREDCEVPKLIEVIAEFAASQGEGMAKEIQAEMAASNAGADALRDVLNFFPDAETMDALDDDQQSGNRYAPTLKSPRMRDVRRWIAASQGAGSREELSELQADFDAYARRAGEIEAKSQSALLRSGIMLERERCVKAMCLRCREGGDSGPKKREGVRGWWHIGFGRYTNWTECHASNLHDLPSPSDPASPSKPAEEK